MISAAGVKFTGPSSAYVDGSINFNFIFLFLFAIQLDNYEIRPGKRIKVNISIAKVRLFVGNIPKQRSRDEIMAEFSKMSGEEKDFAKLNHFQCSSSCCGIDFVNFTVFIAFRKQW